MRKWRGWRRGQRARVLRRLQAAGAPHVPSPIGPLAWPGGEGWYVVGHSRLPAGHGANDPRPREIVTFERHVGGDDWRKRVIEGLPATLPSPPPGCQYEHPAIRPAN